MLDFSNITQKHIDFKKILSNINYNKNINLEMLIKNDNDDELIKLKKSLENFINIYGSI
jgi:UDP-N-acetylmuramyl tripeptide synthase